MKRVGKTEQMLRSPLRRVSLSLLSFLLLFISVTNEIPQLHNHSPIEACAIDNQHHEHCAEPTSPMVEQGSVETHAECIFTQWNKLSQFQAKQTVELVLPLEFISCETVLYSISILKQNTLPYQLRAPPCGTFTIAV